MKLGEGIVLVTRLMHFILYQLEYKAVLFPIEYIYITVFTFVLYAIKYV